VTCNNFARNCNVNIVLKKRDFVLKKIFGTEISEKCNVTAPFLRGNFHWKMMEIAIISRTRLALICLP
jgi:hypothetical protein